MAEDPKKIAESIRSGTYFNEARGWFNAVYIGPVSERTFFMVIAILAGFTALFGVIAVKRLLPISKHEAVLVYAGVRPDDVQMGLIPLAPHHSSINPAIEQFFLTRYVQMREGFDARTFLTSALFIQSQSDATTYNAYANAYDPRNAQSPFAPLGDLGQRQVTVDYARLVDIKTAKGEAPPPAGLQRGVVAFSTETSGVTDPQRTRWTATIDYIYTDLTTKETKNPETKQLDLEVTDPHFQVVNYVLQEQNQPATAQ